MNPRELVLKTLEGRNTDGRAPRQLWTLPYAEQNFPEQLKKITSTFQNDIVEVPPEAKQYRVNPQVTGAFYELGEYIDEWGCQFTNPVSYTHLDVYKRQRSECRNRNPSCGNWLNMTYSHKGG